MVVKLFSEDPDALQTWAQRVADALGRIYVNGKQPIVDIDNGIDSTTSGPALLFTIKPETAAKAGFTTDQLTTITSAMVDGEPATTPVIINDRPYTLRVRYPAEHPGLARSHEQHHDRQLDGFHVDAERARGRYGVAGPDRNPAL